MNPIDQGCRAAGSSAIAARGVPVLLWFCSMLSGQGEIGSAVPAIETRVAAMLQEISTDRIERDVRTLVSFGTRHVLSPTDHETQGTGAARKWLQQQFAACEAASGGRLTVAMQAAEVPCSRPNMPRSVPIVNVIATLRGVKDPGRIYVIGGHYDSRNSQGHDGKGLAPGAVDDASGTAVALEACRVMSRHQFAATLVFVAYDAEEQGLLGSRLHAETLQAAGHDVDGMIACDIVGNTLGMDGKRHDGYVRCFSYAPQGNDSSGRSLARALSFAACRHVPDFGVKLIFRGDRYGRGGDHRSFFEVGYPALRLSEPREDFSRQHQDVVAKNGQPYGDLPEFADFGYMTKVSRLAIATLAELASAPPPPLVVRSARLLRDRYATELVFDLPEGVEDCEFVWRETAAADWTAVISKEQAGMVRTSGRSWRAVLEDVCLDDVVVGVRSVGPDGSRSRVITPAEPDRFDAARATSERRRRE